MHPLLSRVFSRGRTISFDSFRVPGRLSPFDVSSRSTARSHDVRSAVKRAVLSTMRNELRKLCLLLLVSAGITVMMEPKEHVTLDNGQSYSFNEAFGACLSKKEHGTFECVNRGILSALQSLNDKDCLEFGRMQLDRAEGYGRDLLDLDYDPKDFGNVVRAAARLMERRSVKWSLDNLYPGLQMRVGPMLNGDGMLEFVLDERVVPYGDRQAGAGKSSVRVDERIDHSRLDYLYQDMVRAPVAKFSECKTDNSGCKCTGGELHVTEFTLRCIFTTARYSFQRCFCIARVHFSFIE